MTIILQRLKLTNNRQHYTLVAKMESSRSGASLNTRITLFVELNLKVTHKTVQLIQFASLKWTLQQARRLHAVLTTNQLEFGSIHMVKNYTAKNLLTIESSMKTKMNRRQSKNQQMESFRCNLRPQQVSKPCLKKKYYSKIKAV